jgi:Planctomycete cytochrome C
VIATRRHAARVAVMIAIGACTTQDDRPPTWSFISTEILQPSCGTGGCHSALSQTAGVVLDTRADGYRTLVTDPPDGYGPFVVAGDPDKSQLLFMLRGDEIRRMPPDAPLPAADVALIEAWIVAGAGND